MKYLPLNPEIFVQNRKRFMNKMEKNSIAIFNSNDVYSSNGDAVYTFKQNSDLYWLTGIEQEDTMLVLMPSHPNVNLREVLVLIRPDEMKEKWNGHQFTMAEGRTISGIKTVKWLDTLEGFLQAWINNTDIIYLNSNENDRKADLPPTRDYKYASKMKELYPMHQYRRSAVILKELRAIKTPLEIEVMKKAIDITDVTFRRLLGFIKPGVMEYEIEAEIQHSFLSQRSSGPAYSSIIASGDNARILHYVENNQECKDGEVILMDFGAEYGRYCADLSRTVPVNGKFTKRQKTVYNACLHLHKYEASILKPGLSIEEITEKVADEATVVFQKIGLITKADVKNEDPENRAHRKYLYHGVSHHLGIDVHDLGTRTGPIKEGMVFTIEPGIYIEEEQMGFRIENNYWVTKKGNIDLMKNIPIEAEEIESLMKK